MARAALKQKPPEEKRQCRATYEDVLNAPEHMVAEIIHGALETHPRPRLRHASAASNLGMEVGPPFYRGRGGPGGWIILDEPELHLGEHVLVPDLAGWRRERMPQVPDEPWTDLPPDWVCEVVSPATAKHDRGAKRDIYAQYGVKHLWLVDPDARTLEGFELQGGKWVLLKTLADNAEVALAPFAEVPFKLGALWE